MCPAQLTQKAGHGTACGQQGIFWNVFVNEFMTSLLFIFVFLIIKNYKIDDSKWTAYGKSFFIFTAYSEIIGVNRMSNGMMNSTYALQLWFWEMGSYNDGAKNIVENYFITTYNQNYLGRYFWIYIFAPLTAAIPAGLLAKKHI
jgi:glycerol uptake facilitator-like aquaporin